MSTKIIMVELVNEDQIGLHTADIQFDESYDICRNQIPGGKWNKEAKLWIYPKSLKVCMAFRESAKRVNAKLEIGPLLKEWAWEQKSKEDAKKDRDGYVPDVNSFDLQQLPIIQSTYPHLWDAVSTRPFQTVGIKIASSGDRRVLLGDDPGLGKTLQAIGSAVEANLKGLILVVAPKSAALITWPNELKRWAPNDNIIELGGLAKIAPKQRGAMVKASLSRAASSPDRTWVIVGEHWVRAKPVLKDGKYTYSSDGRHVVRWNLPELMDYVWSGIYVDEAHNSLIVKTGDKKKWTQTRFGMSSLKLKDDAIKMAMSGTPFRGNPANLWGILNWMYPEDYTSYWKWVEEFFITFDGGAFGGTEIGSPKNTKKLYDSVKSVFIRRTKSEVARDMPPKLYGGEPLDDRFPDDMIGVWLDMDPKQEKLYKQMEAEALAELENGEVMANGILAELTRLKQFASASAKVNEGNSGSILQMMPPSNKLDWIVEFLDDRGITSGVDKDAPKVIIASQFSSVIDMYDRELRNMGINCWKLTGATKPEDRQEMQKVFQDPDAQGPRVFLLSTKAGGVSLTLDMADDVIINDETWNPDDQLQVEDRAHRLSRPDHNVAIWYLRSRGTIEESICRINAERRGVTGAIMDESRGVVVIRKSIERDAA